MNTELIETQILKTVPGDVVIIRVDMANNTHPVVRKFMEDTQSALPDGVRLIVLDKSLDVEHMDDHAKLELIQGLQDTCQMKRYLVIGHPPAIRFGDSTDEIYAYNIEATSEEAARGLGCSLLAATSSHEDKNNLKMLRWTATPVRWITPTAVDGVCAIAKAAKKTP